MNINSEIELYSDYVTSHGGSFSVIYLPNGDVDSIRVCGLQKAVGNKAIDIDTLFGPLPELISVLRLYFMLPSLMPSVSRQSSGVVSLTFSRLQFSAFPNIHYLIGIFLSEVSYCFEKQLIVNVEGHEVAYRFYVNSDGSFDLNEPKDDASQHPGCRPVNFRILPN